MLVVDLRADDFVLDPEFLEAPPIVAVGPAGVVVILAALLYQHRTAAAVPRAVLERALARPAALRAIAACLGAGLLAPGFDGRQATYQLAGYARDAGTDGGTRRRRVLGALRARKYRAHGEAAIDVPLPFGDVDEAGADEYPRAPDDGGAAPGELWKDCGKPVHVTHAVTHAVTLNRSDAAAPPTSVQDLDLQEHRRQAADRATTAPAGAAPAVNIARRADGAAGPFALLCAVVRKETAARPELAGDRLELLEHVKTVCARARLPYRGADVHKAIEAVAVATARRRS